MTRVQVALDVIFLNANCFMVLATQVYHFGWLKRDKVQTLNLLFIYKGMMKEYKFNERIYQNIFCA